METIRGFDPGTPAPVKVIGPVAMAYVPMQQFKDLYDANEAYERGTVFRALDLPLKGVGR